MNATGGSGAEPGVQPAVGDKRLGGPDDGDLKFFVILTLAVGTSVTALEEPPVTRTVLIELDAGPGSKERLWEMFDRGVVITTPEGRHRITSALNLAKVALPSIMSLFDGFGPERKN